MTKRELLQSIRDEWQSLLNVLAGVEESQKLRPNLIGRWSLKDVMAHISGWESVVLERLGRLSRGEPVDLIADEQVEEMNRLFYERQRDWNLYVVEGEFENVHVRLEGELERFDEEMWDRNEASIQSWIPESTYGHYRHHRQRIEEVLKPLDAIMNEGEQTS